MLHLADIAQKRFGGLVIHHRQPELEPRERRAQIVADPRQHQRALFDLPLDPGAHVEKGRDPPRAPRPRREGV
jgi:hypothetical protein